MRVSGDFAGPTKYINAEITEGMTNPQRLDATFGRPLVPALTIRKIMERVDGDIAAALNQQIAPQHILALIDLRDELIGLFDFGLSNFGNSKGSAFYNGMESLAGPALFVIHNSQKSLRQCIGFYMMQLKPISKN